MNATPHTEGLTPNEQYALCRRAYAVQIHLLGLKNFKAQVEGYFKETGIEPRGEDGFSPGQYVHAACQVNVEALWLRCNPKGDVGFWSGRVDVRVDPMGEVETTCLDGFADGMKAPMQKAGFKLVKSYGLDMGDEDCPKPCTIMLWTKV